MSNYFQISTVGFDKIFLICVTLFFLATCIFTQNILVFSFKRAHNLLKDMYSPE